MYIDNHYLGLRKPHQPKPRLVTDARNKDTYLNEFVRVSESWEFQAGDDGLLSFPWYNGYVPDGEYLIFYFVDFLISVI